MIVDIYYNNSDWKIFFFTSFTTFLIGLVIYFSFRHQKNKIKVREAFFLTIISWILIAIFASLPFIYSSSEWIKASAGDEFTFMIITIRDSRFGT